MHFSSRRVLALGFACLPLLANQAAWAQPKPATPKPAQPAVNVQDSKPADAGPETVQIKREAMKLIDPKAYQVGLQLEPVESITLVAPADGAVSSVPAQTGQKVEPQVEVVRLERTELDLLAKKAEAEFRAANIELRRAKAAKETDGIELAEAHVAAADAALKLAQLRVDRTVIRAPIAAQVFRIFVVPGQVVRAGDPLAQLGNTKQLKVEIPVDRKEVTAGKPVEIRIEDQTVQGKVKDILPLAARFEPIRDLVQSAASATVIVENDKGTFSSGQTVYATLVPRHPVSEVPNSAVANGGDGTRKVQVVREDVVRDIPVQVLGSVGNDHAYVSGAFAERDELIASTSRELADGTRIKLSGPAPAASSAAAAKPAPSTAGKPNF